MSEGQLERSLDFINEHFVLIRRDGIPRTTRRFQGSQNQDGDADERIRKYRPSYLDEEVLSGAETNTSATIEWVLEMATAAKRRCGAIINLTHHSSIIISCV